MDSLVGNVVGAGIKPQSTHPDRAVRERLQALWLRWTDHAAPDGLADGLQAMAVRAMVESGERFSRIWVTLDHPGWDTNPAHPSPVIGHLAPAAMRRMNAIRARTHALRDAAIDRRASRRRDFTVEHRRRRAVSRSGKAVRR